MTGLFEVVRVPFGLVARSSPKIKAPIRHAQIMLVPPSDPRTSQSSIRFSARESGTLATGTWYPLCAAHTFNILTVSTKAGTSFESVYANKRSVFGRVRSASVEE